METEATSACCLAVGFATAWWTTDKLEATLLGPHTPRIVTTAFMGASNLWVYGAAALYVCVVMWHLYHRSAASKAMAKHAADEPGSRVGRVLVLWNFGICFLSMVMMFGMGRCALKFAVEKGFVHLICDGSIMFLQDQRFSMWMVLFTLSKFPELGDTALLMVRGRHVSFLHWYHHVTVMLYCWLAMKCGFPAFIFGWINAFVHSVMYYYYARSTQGARLRIARIVTVIQISQMVVGLLVNCLFVALFSLGWLGAIDACDGGVQVREDGTMQFVLGCTALMYASYLALFARFYRHKWNSLGLTRKAT